MGWRPDDNPLLSQLVQLRQQRGAAFDPLGSGSLIAPILRSPLSHRGSVRGGHAIKPRLTLFAAGQNPSLVQFTLGAATRGFAAFATQMIKRPGNHRAGTEEFIEKTAQGGKGTAELLPEFGELRAGHLYLYNILRIQISSPK